MSKIILNNDGSKYTVVGEVCKELGWISTGNINGNPINNWTVYWSDTSQNTVSLIRHARRYQRVNHFPGMINIYRKGHLARSLDFMSNISSHDFMFFPKSFVLPRDYLRLLSYSKNLSNNSTFFIVKPLASSQGKGIYLMTPGDEINPKSSQIIQAYVINPLLIDGFKFDLRIYALVTCCEPLRILIFSEGLVRLCTIKYEKPTNQNKSNAFMHLTNYAINKHNIDFKQNDFEDSKYSGNESASKRSLSWLMEWLKSQNNDTTKLWQQICDIVVKTLISIQSLLSKELHDCQISPEERSPFTCFEILGFDILLTENLEPILLEVNHSPSFSTDSPLDYHIKFHLIRDTLKLLNLDPLQQQTYHENNSIRSQIRLYGKPISTKLKRHYKTLSNRVNESGLWSSYLLNEYGNKGGYQLIYPTDEHPNQPTSGRQPIYDYLLQAARRARYDAMVVDLPALSRLLLSSSSEEVPEEGAGDVQTDKDQQRDASTRDSAFSDSVKDLESSNCKFNEGFIYISSPLFSAIQHSKHNAVEHSLADDDGGMSDGCSVEAMSDNDSLQQMSPRNTNLTGQSFGRTDSLPNPTVDINVHESVLDRFKNIARRCSEEVIVAASDYHRNHSDKFGKGGNNNNDETPDLPSSLEIVSTYKQRALVCSHAEGEQMSSLSPNRPVQPKSSTLSNSKKLRNFRSK